MKKRKKIIILSVVFSIAEALVLYPFAANIHNSLADEALIVEYEENVSDISREDYEELLEAAYAWNEELYTITEPSYFPDSFTNNEIYESLLNINGDGIMGYIVIPDINLSLPIYHYTTDEVLLKGAGHMQASALPVGGESTHCVITAHRGLPSATMFTNLDELDYGDVFYLKVLGQTLAYEVVEIREVEPDETASLLPQYGRDLCTLVTCTPYGINTKRLLVTGERIEAADEETDAAAYQVSAVQEAAKTDALLLICAAAELAVYIFLLICVIKI